MAAPITLTKCRAQSFQVKYAEQPGVVLCYGGKACTGMISNSGVKNTQDKTQVKGQVNSIKINCSL